MCKLLQMKKIKQKNDTTMTEASQAKHFQRIQQGLQMMNHGKPKGHLQHSKHKNQRAHTKKTSRF